MTFLVSCVLEMYTKPGVLAYQSESTRNIVLVFKAKQHAITFDTFLKCLPTMR